MMKSKRIKVLTGFLLTLTILCGCGGGDDKSGAKLVLNDNQTKTRVEWKQTDGGILIDAGKFMQGVGGRFVPVNMNKGLVAQYGKRIGFAFKDAPMGMVQVQICEMSPPALEEKGKLWAPVKFLEEVIDGDIYIDETKNIISARVAAPLAIGDIVPEAAALSSALEENGYTVQQGDICLSNAIEICHAGYSPNANGNNAGFPYFTIQAPLPPDAEHAVLPAQFVYTMREDEGFVLIGRTPPACDYYSYRSYFLSRCVSDTNPFDRRKIYTQLGDPVNSLNIMEDLFYPYGYDGKVTPFESFFILVSTPDRQVHEDVVNAAMAAGIDPGHIVLDIVDPDLVRLGNDDFADTLSFLHRFSNPHDKSAGQAYLNRPTLEILRLTPKTRRNADFLAPFTPRERGSGVTENNLIPAVEQLRQAIIKKYSDNYRIRELDTHIWLGMTGAEAINSLTDVLGETRDTLYLNTDEFVFDADTVVVVYGVNHTRVRKSIYNNVSCYGADYFNGFGGITNDMYDGNVPAAFPDLGDGPGMENLYVWKFARKALDAQTFAVPLDEKDDLKGIDNGDKAFMAFRNYIDPGSPDLLGPDPDEIIFDRAMVLTPR